MLMALPGYAIIMVLTGFMLNSMSKIGLCGDKMKNKNSMFYWWPIVKDCGVPMPKTIMIRHEDAFKGKLSYDPIDGKPDPAFDEMLEGAKRAAAEIGYPIFLRSDGTANKHDWKNSCYVEQENQLRAHICNILEMTAMTMFGLSFNGVAIREFLKLNWRFTAMHGEMPVAREFRMFVKDGKLQCWHPYWPPASIKKPSIEKWYPVLCELQTIGAVELTHVTELAETIGRVIDGHWSIDLCQTINGEWYMTDMALAENSYHWGTCPNAPPRMLEHYGYPDIVEDPLSQELIKKAIEPTK